MKSSTLLRRSLTHYWRTNLAVVAGVGVAVAVLAGALLVGESVRASLRDLAVLRLGTVELVVTSESFFREALADDLRSSGGTPSPRPSPPAPAAAARGPQRGSRAGVVTSESAPAARAGVGPRPNEEMTRGAAARGGGAPRALREAGEGGRRPGEGDSAAPAVPLIALEGFVTHQTGGRRASSVQVFGVDERFWRFHQRTESASAPAANELLLSEGLARELGAAEGDALLVRVQKPSAIPVSSLHGRREDLGRTMRLTVKGILTPDALGEFSIRPQQGLARSVFLSLDRLQRDLEQPDRVNVILIGERGSGTGGGSGTIGGSGTGVGSGTTGGSGTVRAVEDALRRAASLEDLGLIVRPLPDRQTILVESEAGLLDDGTVTAVESAAGQSRLSPRRILTYLANEIRIGDRSIPYSLLTALDSQRLQALPTGPIDPSVGVSFILNSWAAEDLAARPGDVATVEYYVWADEGRLLTRQAEFQVAAIVPIQGLAADRELAPKYPGITEAESVVDWDPPFEIDLSRIRPRDEEYWDRYRTTPKGFITLPVGQELWQSRWGKVTSVRIDAPDAPDLEAAASAFGDLLRASLDPIASGFVVYPARALALEASVGATDFGEYFTYFSFFLVVAALLLASLFFRLGVEQRLKEIGLLRACGFPPARIRWLFWAEAAVLASAGSAAGVLGAMAYARFIMWGLRTWWIDAVGTHLLAMHVTPGPLVVGALGGLGAAFAASAWTLRSLTPASARSLLAGTLPEAVPVATGRATASSRRVRLTPTPVAIVLAATGLGVMVVTLGGLIGDTVGFFGAGLVLLGASLVYVRGQLRVRPDTGGSERGASSLVRIGFRNATSRPGRSVLSIALIASATFIIVAVDAFRRDPGVTALDRRSGTGGFSLVAESLLPIVHDPASEAGREALNLADLTAGGLRGVELVRFRVRPGEDASCLNLYQAKDPRILAPTKEFVDSGRFAFSTTLAESAEEIENPWLLLNKEFPDGAIPAIADATSLTYALHLGVGEDFVLRPDSDRPVRLRIVAALTDSLFQRELLIAEPHFMRLFPEHEGYRFFLVDAPPETAGDLSAALEERLSDFGVDVAPAAERLAVFHRVENTYLATFQTLGGLGLLLGTVGLAAVLLRNVLERRRELALLRAVGYNAGDLRLIVLAENVFLLATGLVLGTLCALVAIAPAWTERGGRLPVVSLGWLLGAVVVTGLAASLVATAASLRAPLLSSLRTE